MSKKDWTKNKLDGESSNKTFIGTVEDNNDPKRLGRIKVRVFDMFDEKDKNDKYEISVEDLPWATSWKDVNGNNFNIPDIGKVITVIFEDGNKNNPIYISSDHYNSNLENKLSQLSEPDYLSMKALLYDHKTQIYVNDDEGLKIDYNFNNVNIKEKSININLKDNFGKINIGSPNSTQRAILGDNFVNWFDEFLNILMGNKGGPFLGNLLAPVVASPALISQIQLFGTLKDPKILSKNVYIVDNDSVTMQERTEGVTEGQKGDTWQSTVDENKLTTKEPVKFTPVEGATNTTFNKPPPDASTPVATTDLANKPTQHPDIDVLLEMLRLKKYKIFTKPYELNIVSIRNQCLNSGDKYTDEFVDSLYVFWKDDKDFWQLKKYVFSTVPGVEFEVNDSWISEKKFSGKELEYWNSKKGSKITMKDFYKGPVIPSTEPKSNFTKNESGTNGTNGTERDDGVIDISFSLSNDLDKFSYLKNIEDKSLAQLIFNELLTTSKQANTIKQEEKSLKYKIKIDSDSKSYSTILLDKINSKISNLGFELEIQKVSSSKIKFKLNGKNVDNGTKGDLNESSTITSTTLKKLEKDGFKPTPFEMVSDKILLDSNIIVEGKTKSDAQLALDEKLKSMKVDNSNGAGSIFYNESGQNVIAKWIIYQK